MYKVFKMEGTSPLIDLSNLHANHDHSTRNRHNLVPVFPRIEAIRLNFEHQFVMLWNTIPLDVQNSDSINIFKKKLKNFFLTSY